MAKDYIAIIDYGSGNLRSAAKAFEHVVNSAGLPFDVKLVSAAHELDAASHIVLPGQGAFGDCMAGLKAVDGMINALEENIRARKKPFLGICVGMQLLADRGLEHGEHAGLGWISGDVVPLKFSEQPTDKSLKIPHMGWNTLDKIHDHFVLRGIECEGDSADHYYFVHSFMFECKEGKHILATSEYGGAVTAIVGEENIIGVQFHPEKSQKAGLHLLRNFVDMK